MTVAEPKAWQGHFFEDFAVGQRFECPVPRTISVGDAALYLALTGDRTAPFCGPTGRVHPLVTFHVAFAQTVRLVSLNARANLGYADVRWGVPLRWGDTMRTRVEVIGLRENARGETGIVYTRNTATTASGALAVRFDRWVMVRKRARAETRYLSAPVVPELPPLVVPEALAVDDVIADVTLSEGRWRLGDYRPGERIDHLDRMTVNAADHMSFTRLFQNSARLHFDPDVAPGGPLVYGGVVISLGYALAHNGLERRLGLVAINAGTHAAPTYAGDVLGACTEVIEVVPLTPRIGALRCRMLVRKRSSAGASTALAEERAAGGSRTEGVVLDLDYWELMPV